MTLPLSHANRDPIRMTIRRELLLRSALLRVPEVLSAPPAPSAPASLAEPPAPRRPTPRRPPRRPASPPLKG